MGLAGRGCGSSGVRDFALPPIKRTAEAQRQKVIALQAEQKAERERGKPSARNRSASKKPNALPKLPRRAKRA